MTAYYNQTVPIIEYYKAQNLLKIISISDDATIADVTSEIDKVVLKNTTQTDPAQLQSLSSLNYLESIASDYEGEEVYSSLRDT